MMFKSRLCNFCGEPSCDCPEDGLEADLEKHVIRYVNKLGGRVKKLVINGERDWPDLTIFFPEVVGFLELKRPGESPRPGQYQMLAWLQKLGQREAWADNFICCKRFIERLKLQSDLLVKAKSKIEWYEENFFYGDGR